MPVSKATRQSVDTTLPKNIRTWVLNRDALMTAVEAKDYKKLPSLAKTLRDTEKKIAEVKSKIANGNVDVSDVDYVNEKYNELIRGEDNRKEKGQTGGNKKKTPFFKDNGDAFTAQDITDALGGGNFASGFLANRVSNPDSAEYKSLVATLTPSDSITERIRKTQTVEELKSPTKEEPKESLSKEKQAEENQKVADAKQKKIIDDANAEIEAKKQEDEAKKAKYAEVVKQRAEEEAKEAKEKAEEEAKEAKEKAEEEEGVTVKDADEEEKEEEKPRASIRGGGKATVTALEDVAEEEGLKGVGVGDRPSLPRSKTDSEYFDSTEGQEGMNEAPAPTPPMVEPDDLPDNRGTVEEAPDILDASRGGAGMTPSGIVKGGDSSGKEDAQRGKMNIARLKEEIRALHLIYDNNIDKFRSNPHKADKDDALKSDKVEVVRKHHKDMEVAIREYYRSGGGDTLQVGVIVPIDTYLQQYLSGGKPNEQAIAKAPTRTVGKEGTTSVGLGHRDGDLKAKSHDPYSRAIAQGIYYQRGGMGSYKQRAVSGHAIKIGGKDKMGQIKDPRTRVDAVMNNFLNRAVVELPDPSLKLKTK